MPLHVPPAPAPALRTVLTALGSPTAVREARTPSLLRAQGPATPELPLPVHVLGEELPEPTRAPKVGEHTDEVLADVLGYEPSRIAALRESGALG